MSPAHREPSPTAREPGNGASAEAEAFASSSMESVCSLVRRLREGEESALTMLYQRYSAVVHGLALRILGSPSDAEEVVVDVFVQAWSRIDRFDDGRGTLCTWLLLMTRTRALDRLRKRRRRAEALSEAEASPGGPWWLDQPDSQEIETQVECRTTLEPLLDRLPDTQRQVIELAYFGGMSQSEIARTLDTPLGTVKSRMRTGMHKLCAWADHGEDTG